MALLAALFLIARSAVNSQLGQISPAIGKPAPQFDLVLLSDDLNLDRLQTLPRDKVTLLHFWGTWCGPCRMEYPRLSVAATKLGQNEQFQFVPVTCEYGPNETFQGLWNKTQEYFDEAHIVDRTAFADPGGVTRRSAAERLGQTAMAYPTSILIDRQGMIAGVWEGYTPAAIDEIERAAKELIAASGP